MEPEGRRGSPQPRSAPAITNVRDDIEPTCRASGCAPTLVPNDETVKAIEAARRGELITVGGVAGLMAHLNEDD